MERKGEQLNRRLFAVPTDSYNPSLASLHVKHVIVIMDSRFLSGSTHTHTHTHRGSVYACEPSVCSPRQLTGLGVRGFPLLGRSMHFLSELNSLQTGSLCQPLPSLFALYKLAEICSHKKFQGSVNPENADGGNSLTLNCAC